MNRTRRKNIKITFLFTVLSVNLYAQLVPDRALVDQKKLALCKMEVEAIESMQLKCDTLYFKRDSFYFNTHFVDDDWFTGIYFDNHGRLRKNIEKWAIHDGSHDTVDLLSYYNENGDLVYLKRVVGSNCDDEKTLLYLHNRQIVDWEYDYDCGCCGDDADEQEWIENNHPIIGDEWNTTANNLLNFYYEKYEYEDAIVMPGTIIPEKVEPHFCDEKSLKSLRSFAILDSIDSPKAYVIRHNNYSRITTAIAIKKENQYAVFSLFPDGIHFAEFEIARQNIDNAGNDELVIRWKNSDNETGILVWNLDTYSYILNIFETRYNYFGEVRHIADGTGHNVDLDGNRLTVQIVKNRKKEILGLKYIYNFTESGFVLDKVE